MPLKESNINETNHFLKQTKNSVMNEFQRRNYASQWVQDKLISPDEDDRVGGQGGCFCPREVRRGGGKGGHPGQSPESDSFLYTCLRNVWLPGCQLLLYSVPHTGVRYIYYSLGHILSYELDFPCIVFLLSVCVNFA